MEGPVSNFERLSQSVTTMRTAIDPQQAVESTIKPPVPHGPQEDASVPLYARPIAWFIDNWITPVQNTLRSGVSTVILLIIALALIWVAIRPMMDKAAAPVIKAIK